MTYRSTKYVLRAPGVSPVSIAFHPSVDPSDAFDRACALHEVARADCTFFKVGALRKVRSGHGEEFYREPGEFIA